MDVAARIREQLAALEPVSLELGAAPGGQTHWRLSIVSPRFEGQPTVARHRMVYEALGGLMQHPIHALAISARSPEELKGNR
jgi:BolA protein